MCSSSPWRTPHEEHGFDGVTTPTLQAVCEGPFRIGQRLIRNPHDVVQPPPGSSMILTTSRRPTGSRSCTTVSYFIIAVQTQMRRRRQNFPRHPEQASMVTIGRLTIERHFMIGLVRVVRTCSYGTRRVITDLVVWWYRPVCRFIRLRNATPPKPKHGLMS
jgi:hypothetical protein